MNSPGQMLWGFELTLNKGFVDHHLRRDIGQFTPLLSFDLLAHRFKVALHPINTDRNAIDQRKRLRVLGQNRRKHAWYNVSKQRELELFRGKPSDQ